MKFQLSSILIALILSGLLMICGCGASTTGLTKGNRSNGFKNEASPGESAEAFLQANTYSSVAL